MAKSEKFLIAKLNGIVTSHGSRQAAAEHLGISQKLLAAVLQKQRPISKGLAKTLGFKRISMFTEIRP